MQNRCKTGEHNYLTGLQTHLHFVHGRNLPGLIKKCPMQKMDGWCMQTYYINHPRANYQQASGFNILIQMGTIAGFMLMKMIYCIVTPSLCFTAKVIAII